MKISVITAVRNRVATVGEALDSVHSQSWPDVEHVVVDGVSTDGSLELLQTRRGQIAVLVSERDSGIYDALNKGLALASGDVIGLMHSDDIYADDRVLADVAAAFLDPDIDAVYGDLDYVSQDDTGRVIRRWRSGEYSPDRLAQGWMPPHPTLYLRRRVIERWGGFDETFRIAADYDHPVAYRIVDRRMRVPRRRVVADRIEPMPGDRCQIERCRIEQIRAIPVTTENNHSTPAGIVHRSVLSAATRRRPGRLKLSPRERIRKRQLP